MSVMYCQSLSGSAAAVGGSVPLLKGISVVVVVVVVVGQKRAFHSLPFFSNLSRDCNL